MNPPSITARLARRRPWSRRAFLRRASIAALALGNSRAWAQTSGRGGFLSDFFAFDREVKKFMELRKVPGGALAVVKDRRLVYARGYGVPDRESGAPVQPTSLFRIASISKPFTAAAILKLVERRKLDLDARVVDLLTTGAGALPVQRSNQDDRWPRITVRHLLHHTGGWDRDASFDPMFRSREIAKALGVPSPPAPRDIARYMLGRPLDFDPGTRYAYSNFGYCLLGRLIENLAGTSYEKFVGQTVLEPAGIKTMRLGASLDEKRAENEVRYYTPRNETTESVFGDKPEPVPWPYGGFCLESMDAHGGWIGSVIDLARFAAALRDPNDCPFLGAPAFQMMHAPPEPPVWRKADGSLEDHYYGCGWLVRPVGSAGKANYWHTGSLPGTFTLLVRRWDGVSWAVVFNQRSDDDKLPDGEIDPALHRAADAVTAWPKFDLFRQYR